MLQTPCSHPNALSKTGLAQAKGKLWLTPRGQSQCQGQRGPARLLALGEGVCCGFLGGHQFLQQSTLFFLSIRGIAIPLTVQAAPILSPTRHRPGEGEQQGGQQQLSLVLSHFLGPIYSDVTIASPLRSCSLHLGEGRSMAPSWSPHHRPGSPLLL